MSNTTKGKDLIKMKTISITEEEINLLEDALDNQFSSQCEMDEEMLREEIRKGDWDFAMDICFKFKQTGDAFKLLKKLKERINNNGVEEKEKDKSGTDS